MDGLESLRADIHAAKNRSDHEALERLIAAHGPSEPVRRRAEAEGAELVRRMRSDRSPSLMEAFLAEYGLSTREGVALMCLAEALLRVPDTQTIDELIEDKIGPSHWGRHLGIDSVLVNASTWALMLTGGVLREGEGMAAVLRGLVKRLGEPVIRTAVGRAIRELGQQFVLGQDIDTAIRRGAARAGQGYTYSYDMLGEAALTEADAQAYFSAYAGTMDRLAPLCGSADIRDNPGISIKLSALHPRYEFAQRERVMAELVPRVRALAHKAAAAGMGLNIDAEEADRLDISLDVIEAVLPDPELAGWDGFGVVVQSYGKRAPAVLDWLEALAAATDRRIMVRLVKGAYWDTEIKRSQIEGAPAFSVFSQKAATDMSYICCANALLNMGPRVYPQFATHNAHTIAAVLALAGERSDFEFQRLHGMGEALHDLVHELHGRRCRIYAPVGAHRDLLAYLVRRLLENGANRPFVNQIVDERLTPEDIAADPFARWPELGANPAVVAPADLFAPERVNSRGWERFDSREMQAIDAARAPYRDARWTAEPLLAGAVRGTGRRRISNPARPDDTVGSVVEANRQDAETALARARPWQATAAERADVLRRASDLYEAHAGAFFALLAREAGKCLPDAISELREAVDFLRYYAARGEEVKHPPRGVIGCISPWNFPLAIFTGQIAGALAAGNAVIAKPAEATPLVAARAVALLHEAGVPRSALQFLPGAGGVVGAALAADARIGGLCFTGSTETARAINRAMAAGAGPRAPLVAETGGLNAMIVDSTALPEQAIRDILASAFQSAGQRCSALRMLYVQDDVADGLLDMLFGAMDELTLGQPWSPATDVGPVIDAAARDAINAHVERAAAEGRLLKRLKAPQGGSFVAPAVIALDGIGQLEREIFGPVLHVARFAAADLDAVVDAVNARGYGLTFGMHSRIDDRVEQVLARLRVGNIYVNRNQIGAVVGSQPFGGEGMSGTGPKAGGPAYVARLADPGHEVVAPVAGRAVTVSRIARMIETLAPPRRRPLRTADLPGPTGESNRLSIFPRGTVLCLGPDAASAGRQAAIARAAGCRAVQVAPGATGEGALDGWLPRDALARLDGIDAVALWSDEADLRAARSALARRDGALVPLLSERDLDQRCILERHVCIDTTAAGGNATLLAQAG